MQTAHIPANPFLLMMEPEAVIHAMQHSKDLRRLRHHKYRPLDRPWIPFASSQKTLENLVKPSASEGATQAH